MGDADMINFNGMLFRLGLFYAEKLGNCIHCTFIFTLFMPLFLKMFCAHGPIKYK